MVGVPGRSRACQTCRNRRVRCDGERPVCSQCAKKSRPCTYERNHVFVNNDKGTHKTVYRKTDGSLAASYPQNYETTITNGSTGATTGSSDPSAENEFISQPTPFWKTPSLRYSSELALVANAIDFGKSSQAYSLYGLLSRSMEIDAPGQLYSAPLACYAAWRGRQERDPNLINASHKFYVQALVETQKALRDPTTALNDSTLAACNALGVFEALECPDRDIAGFRWHRDACTKLIELRGPEAHQEGLAHVLFIAMRTFGFLEGFERARPTFWGTPEWMTVPWQTQSKSANDKLVDTLSHGPSLLQKARELEVDEKLPPSEQKFDGAQRLAIVLEIGRDLADVVHELDTFYDGLEKERKMPLYTQAVAEEGETDLTFSPVLHFPDLAVASALTLHWALLTLVWGSLEDCYLGCQAGGVGKVFVDVFQSRYAELANLVEPQLSEADTVVPQARYADMSAFEIRYRYLNAARKVCQSVAYCTSEEALESGPPRVATALSIVIDSIQKRPCADVQHVYTWASNARRSIGNQWVKLLRYHP